MNEASSYGHNATLRTLNTSLCSPNSLWGYYQKKLFHSRIGESEHPRLRSNTAAAYAFALYAYNFEKNARNNSAQNGEK